VTIRRREGSRSPVHIHLEDTAPVHVHVQKPKKPHFTAFDVRKLRRVINETSDQSGLGYKQRFLRAWNNCRSKQNLWEILCDQYDR